MPFVEYKGKLCEIDDLTAIAGVSKATIMSRLRTGWTVEDAVTVPIRGTPKTPPKWMKRKQGENCDGTLLICFMRPVTGVFNNMQPKLLHPYTAAIHEVYRGKRFYSVDIGKHYPLIVYDGEFVELYEETEAEASQNACPAT